MIGTTRTRATAGAIALVAVVAVVALAGGSNDDSAPSAAVSPGTAEPIAEPEPMPESDSGPADTSDPALYDTPELDSAGTPETRAVTGMITRTHRSGRIARWIVDWHSWCP